MLKNIIKQKKHTKDANKIYSVKFSHQLEPLLTVLMQQNTSNNTSSL